MIIQTKRLILREIELADASDIYEYAKLQEVCVYTQEKIHTSIEDTLESIYDFHFEYEARNAFPTYVLELLATGKVIGLVSLHTKIKENVFEIGFECNPKFQKQGYMYEALVAYLDYLSMQQQVKWIVSEVLKDNIASMQLLLKLGFELVKTENQIHYYRKENL